MTALAGAEQVCAGCQEKVVFITEAFGCVCTRCGTIVEEADDLTSDNGALYYKINSSLERRNTFQHGFGRIQREAQKMNWAFHPEHRQSRPEIDGVIGAILARYKRSNLQRDVQDLILQVQTMQDVPLKALKDAEGRKEVSDEELEEGPSVDDVEVAEARKRKVHGEQAISKLAVAATFSILKKYDKAITLEDVCSVSNIASQSQIADSLRYMERLLGDTALLTTSRDSPSMYIAVQIGFLLKQIRLKPRSRLDSPIEIQDDESVLEQEEQRFVQEAKVDSSSFKKLATDLCELCSFHGLNNRSLKTAIKKDLVICAWAILILAMEASSGQVCNQGKMAKIIVPLRTWHEGGVTAAKPEDYSSSLQDKEVRTAMEEVVKKRYVEVSRMLTLYLEQLPWLADERPSAKEKKASKSKARGKVADVKQELSSIKPFPRKTVAKYLTDVIALRHHIEKRLSSKSDEWASMQWSRFSSTEDQFHRIRASVDGQRRIKEEDLQYQSQQRSDAISLSSSDGLLRAVDDLLSQEKGSLEQGSNQSKLAVCIGTALLQSDSLNEMADDVVDSLLFEEGEMESYLRTSEEISVIQALRGDKGDWDASTSISSGLKRARSEEEHDEIKKINFIDGKKTKALTEGEATRILSLL
jgi:hypothetical protein